MSSKKTIPAPVRSKESAGDTSTQAPQPSSADGFRETVESVVVAFILAFLFRTFEAEAFVIPTGSMAETLMGRHKEVDCEQCGYLYRVSASPEIDQDRNERDTSTNLMHSTCPMCRYTMSISTPAQREKFPSYNGDRILVAKFPYRIGEPKRWDVIVFKQPAHAHINFIKRLVGLPGETVRIVHGDIFTRRGDDPFLIARKEDPQKLQAMLQTVYDNDYRLESLLDAGWPARWQPWAVPLESWVASDDSAETPVVAVPESLPAGHWQTDDRYRSFHTDGAAPGETWLRYQHTVPSPDDWRRVLDNKPVPPQTKLIDDFSSYNSGWWTNPRHNRLDDHYWVGDLAVACQVEVSSPSGEVVLELVEGRARFQCRFDLKTGVATLGIKPVVPVKPQDEGSARFLGQHQPLDEASLQQFRPQAKTVVQGSGIYGLVFANVDDQLRLWVDGEEVVFDTPNTFAPLGNTVAGKADFAPVGIASAGAAIRVNHLNVYRDIFYIATNDSRVSANRPQGIDFRLQADQFFVLGDNSARSQDARMWTPSWERYVQRDLLIGKALYVYWPHSYNHIPGTKIPFPMYPNFGRMGLVR